MMNGPLLSVSVLIVDDDEYQRRLLSKMLAALGVVDVKQAVNRRGVRMRECQDDFVGTIRG